MIPASESHKQPGHARGRGGGEHRQAEAHEAVGADLQQHARQEHAAGCRGLDVGQRQPGVQRHQRHLHREAGKQRQEDPKLPPGVHGLRGQVPRQLGDREGHHPAARGKIMGIIPEHHRQQTQQRQHAAGEREEEELHRRVTPLVAPPNADQEEQRHQRELEEQVEEDDVAGDEDPQHARLQDQQ